MVKCSYINRGVHKVRIRVRGKTTADVTMVVKST